jgi:hypothetical protein
MRCVWIRYAVRKYYPGELRQRQAAMRAVAGIRKHCTMEPDILFRERLRES